MSDKTKTTITQDAEAIAAAADAKAKADAEAKIKADEEAATKAKAAADAKVKKAEQLIEVQILRDFWDEKGERQPEGKIIKVPVETALDGIESGALARVKPDKK